MSWSRRKFLLISGSGLLAGCGFQPLYRARSSPSSVPAQFALIEVDQIDGRAGHHLRNYLIDSLSGRGGQYKKQYHLKVVTSDQKDGLAIRADEAVTRFNYRLVSSVELSRKTDQQIVFRSTLRATSAYNVVDSEFATLSAERDAQERAARDMSTEIITRLAIYFQREAQKPPA